MKHKATKGENGLWGVSYGGSVLYEAMFCKATAEALADMEDSENPPKDWFEASDRLESMGLPF